MTCWVAGAVSALLVLCAPVLLLTPGPATGAPRNAFYAEPPMPQAQARAARLLPVRAQDLPAPLRRTFTLESNPGATVQIYLSFTGDTLVDTAWNLDFEHDKIVVQPWSLDQRVDTHFSRAELIAIQQAWQVTAEDFAPFDVNVTLKPPTPEALERSSADDQSFGTTVLVSHGGPVARSCRCGGLAYANVFGVASADRPSEQPALVFGQGPGTEIGEAISHEVGHNFGLGHDGTKANGYYEGRGEWAPIMGSGYDRGFTQWSSGEYTRASNQQDDLAIIARTAPLRTDDHGDDPATASVLLPLVPVSGIISSRTDVDAFTFLAAGRMSMTVRPVSGKANLAIGIQILDAVGNVVDVKDAGGRANGRVTWVVPRSRTPRSYTVVVDGSAPATRTCPGTSATMRRWAATRWGYPVADPRRIRSAVPGTFVVTSQARPGVNQYCNARGSSTVHTSSGSPARRAKRATPARASHRCATRALARDSSTRRRGKSWAWRSLSWSSSGRPATEPPTVSPTRRSSRCPSAQSRTARTVRTDPVVTTTRSAPSAPTACATAATSWGVSDVA